MLSHGKKSKRKSLFMEFFSFTFTLALIHHIGEHKNEFILFVQKHVTTQNYIYMFKRCFYSIFLYTMKIN